MSEFRLFPFLAVKKSGNPQPLVNSRPYRAEYFRLNGSIHMNLLHAAEILGQLIQEELGIVS